MHDHLVHTLAELGILLGSKDYPDASVTSLPASSAILAAIEAARRDSYMHPFSLLGIEQNGVNEEAAVAGHPARPVRVIVETSYERPCAARIARLK